MFVRGAVEVSRGFMFYVWSFAGLQLGGMGFAGCGFERRWVSFLVLRSFWKEEGGAGGFGICVLGWVEGLGKLVAIDGNDFREFDRNKKFVVSVYIEPGASLF